MTTSLVLPTDNAVIDYSIISQMIAVINSQQQQIDTYLKTISTTDPSTGQTITSAQKIVGSYVPADTTGKLFTVSWSSIGLSKATSIVGIPYNSGSTTTISCWLSSMNSTQAQFRTSAKATNLYFIAVGS